VGVGLCLEPYLFLPGPIAAYLFVYLHVCSQIRSRFLGNNVHPKAAFEMSCWFILFLTGAQPIHRNTMGTRPLWEMEDLLLIGILFQCEGLELNCMFCCFSMLAWLQKVRSLNLEIDYICEHVKLDVFAEAVQLPRSKPLIESVSTSPHGARKVAIRDLVR
jgi:hypothetical protein